MPRRRTSSRTLRALSGCKARTRSTLSSPPRRYHPLCDTAIYTTRTTTRACKSNLRRRRRRRTSAVPRQSSKRERADVKKKRKRDILTHAPHALHSVTFTPSSPHHPFLHITLTCETTARGQSSRKPPTPIARAVASVTPTFVPHAAFPHGRPSDDARARARASSYFFRVFSRLAPPRARSRPRARRDLASTRIRLDEASLGFDDSNRRIERSISSIDLDRVRSDPIERTNEGARGRDARATSRRRIPETWRDEARDGRSR